MPRLPTYLSCKWNYVPTFTDCCQEKNARSYVYGGMPDGVQFLRLFNISVQSQLDLISLMEKEWLARIGCKNILWIEQSFLHYTQNISSKYVLQYCIFKIAYFECFLPHFIQFHHSTSLFIPINMKPIQMFIL